MFVDASAIVAILADEPDATVLSAKLDAAGDAHTSAIVHYESVLGLARATKLPIAEATDIVERFALSNALRNLAIDAIVAQAAVETFARYGKGRHRAGLNLGDCFAYACAKSLGVPLLCKGDDFPHTDIQLA